MSSLSERGLRQWIGIDYLGQLLAVLDRSGEGGSNRDELEQVEPSRKCLLIADSSID